MSKESELLTKGCYHLSMAKEYFDGFKLECKLSAKKQASSWVNKIQWIENDVFNALTPKSRELFKEEIKNGDILFFANLSENILMMTPKQRELIESISENILKGEIIEFKK